ncbi:MAG: hypothetical protein WBQ75_03245 [Acetobacteraceae bacterium]
MTRMDEVAEDIHRISVFVPEVGLTFNQFLIADEQSALIHTGYHAMYDDVRRAVASVLDPGRLAYVVVPHFEADECGGMARFAAAAPGSVLVCSDIGMRVNLSHWDFSGPVQGVQDGAILELGRHRLRFLETPHVHHWDSMMVVEETTRSLFPADLFLQPGEQPVVVREDLGREMCAVYRATGIFASEGPVLRAVDRIERMALRWVHPMHGGSLSGEALPHYTEALRAGNFAYDGRLLGRRLPA